MSRLLDSRNIRTLKLFVGALLGILVIGTVAGILYLSVLKANGDAVGGDEPLPLAGIVVETPEGAVFDGAVRADTPLVALERAGAAAGFGVARTADGGSLLAAAGHRNGDGGQWIYRVERGGDVLDFPGPEGSFALEDGDRVVWSWRAR